MPDRRWPRRALGDLALKIQDGTHFSPQSDSGPCRYVTSRNIRFGYMDLSNCGWISEIEHRSIYRRCDVQQGDVLLTKDGANTGNAALNSLAEEMSLLSSVAFVRPNSTLATAGFILQYLLSTEGQQRLQDLMSGNAIRRLTLAKIMAFDVPVPPLPEQRRIAEVLDTVDEAIRKTEEIIAKLKQVKQGLLHDLLTRGIDDNGELRDPDRHPEQFKDSPLGRIPKAWEVVPLASVVPKTVYGISESLGTGPGIPILRMMNIKDGEADLADLKYSASEAARGRLLRPGDVLFNRTNSIDHVGRTGIWRGQIQQASFASYLVRLESDPKRLGGEFLNRWLNWERTQLRIRRYATPGVHQVNINPTNLRKVLIALPLSLREQSEIASRQAAIDERVLQSSREGAKLRLLKQGLMEDLLTGRVRVTPLLEEAAE